MKGVLRLGFRIAISFLVLALLFSRVDAGNLAELFASSGIWLAILVSTMAQILQGLLGALRQIEILSLLGYPLSLFESVRVWFSGLVVSQIAFSFIGGDVVRAVQLIQGGVSRRTAARAIILDRVIGLAPLLILVVAALPVLFCLTDDESSRRGIWVLGAVCVLAAVVLILSAPMLQLLEKIVPSKVTKYPIVAIGTDLAGVVRFLLAAPKQSMLLVGMGAVMHALNILGIIIIARYVGAQASPWLISMVAIPVMFVSMLPISVAGWGVREAAMVTGFSLLHVPPEIALTTSIGFGLSRIAASLPGLLFIIKQAPPSAEASKRRANK